MQGEHEVVVTGIADSDLYVRETAIRYAVDHHKGYPDTATDDALIATAGRIEAFIRSGAPS